MRERERERVCNTIIWLYMMFSLLMMMMIKMNQTLLKTKQNRKKKNYFSTLKTIQFECVEYLETKTVQNVMMVKFEFEKDYKHIGEKLE